MASFKFSASQPQYIRFKLSVVLVNNWISMQGHIYSCLYVRMPTKYAHFKSVAKHVCQGGQ